jgi:TnpA family transposase
VGDFPVRPDDDELLVAEFEMLELQSALMRALRSHSRHLATLARAITQIGRAAKTFHPLDDCNHPHYRRGILGQLNRGERRHDLGR